MLFWPQMRTTLWMPLLAPRRLRKFVHQPTLKRMKNILRQGAESKSKVAEPFNPDALTEAEEKKLAAAIPQVANNVNALRAARRYEQALLEISQLRPAID